jgi:hypothetical protein
MKKLVLEIFSLSLIICGYFLFYFGCSSTKPNTPYKGPCPESFNELAYKNSKLAEEIGKIPEIQNGISENDFVVIEKIVSVYNSNPLSFEKAFKEMYQIGLPEVRKYCSPLQALFWLAEDNILSLDYVVEYSLHKLLDSAWTQKFSTNQVSQIIKGTKNERIRTKIIQYSQDANLEGATKYILLKYANRPELFYGSARKIISKGPPRWNDINEIIDRMNSPELLDFYINSNIRYKFKIGGFHRSPSRVIKSRYGDCDDLAYFGKITLTRAGYDVFGRIVGDENTSCHIGLVIRLEDKSYLVAVDFRSNDYNHMNGPFKTLLEADKSLGYGYQYRQRGQFNFTWRK